MFVTGHCDIKINLTLRVLNRRDDGYHNICSLIWRRPSPETIQADFCAESDSLTVVGAEIPGENILTAACRHIRSIHSDDFLPPVKIILHKCLPLGGGVGAGSGNAAVFLRLARRVTGYGDDSMFPDVTQLGADVAFLASEQTLAIACGVGDIFCGVGENLNMSGLIFFPEWSVSTAHAYHALDGMRITGRDVGVSGEEQARDEALSLLGDLRSGRVVGRIPNDFSACAGHEDEYALLEDFASSSGAVVWGLCGSGSGYFVFFRQEDAVSGMRRLFCAVSEKKYSLSWLRQILVLE